ncbi:MAG: heme exporter protein CcmD [Pseudomonadota bacterium]
MVAVAKFLDMGGYALFVWPSYAISALVLAALAIASWRSLRAREAELAASEAPGSARPDQRPSRRGGAT